MYNFSFICRASKIDKKGFAPIELSIIINGTRTYVILPMKYEPTLFNKMMTSKKNGSPAKVGGLGKKMHRTSPLRTPTGVFNSHIPHTFYPRTHNIIEKKR